MNRDEYDDLLRHLVRIAAHQDSINDDLREFARQQLVINDRHDIFLAEHMALNHRLVDIHQDVKTTLARIETLLARMIDRSDNGRDA